MDMTLYNLNYEYFNHFKEHSKTKKQQVNK